MGSTNLVHSLKFPDHEPGHESMAVPISAPINGIRMEYHPNSGRPTVTHTIDDPSIVPPPLDYPLKLEPWSPFFEMHKDFIISEVILEGALGSELVDKLLKVFNLCHASKGKVTLKNFLQVQTAVQRASTKLSPVSSGVLCL